MSKREIYAAIKRATVAIAMEIPNRLPQRPFTTIGSGFCIHPDGIVVTCEHVFRAFFDPDAYKKLMQTISDGEPPQAIEMKDVKPPMVLFHGGTQGTNIFMNQVGVSDAVTKTDFDLAVFKLQKHVAFPDGFAISATRCLTINLDGEMMVSNLNNDTAKGTPGGFTFCAVGSNSA